MSYDPQFEKYFSRNFKLWSNGKHKGKKVCVCVCIWDGGGGNEYMLEMEGNRKWFSDIKQMFMAGYSSNILVIWVIFKFSSI